MQKYRGSQLIRAGFIGVVLIILVIAIGLQPERLISWATALRYQAMFTEAGGLNVGNDVTVSGIKVGSVSSVELVNGDALVGFTIQGKYALGSDSSAHIRTGTLLGERVLALESAGSGTLDRRQAIPTTRTSSPYSLTDAVSELTANSAGTDTDTLNQSLDTLSQTLDQIAPQLGPTFDGVSRLSRSLNNRNESLAELLKTAGDVTGVFSERSQQVNSLILNSNDLLAVLNDRRYAITSLLSATSAVSQELTGVVADNEKELAPTLERLNSGHRDAGEESRQSREDAARSGEILSDTGRDRVERRLLQRAGAQPRVRTASAAVPRLRLRVPARCRCRPAAGHRRTAGRTAVPRQQYSAARRPSQ